VRRRMNPVVAVALAASVVSCNFGGLVPGPKPPPSDGCTVDADCTAGQICVFKECVDIDLYACAAGETPLITVTPAWVEFGEVAVETTGEQKVTIGNVGDCNLTVSQIGISDDSAAGFSCSPCDFTAFPLQVPPQRELEIIVSYKASKLGQAFGQMSIRSDDQTTSGGLVKADLHAAYNGTPVLVIDPPEIHFGYVAYSAGIGATATQRVTIKNMGSGTLKIGLVTVNDEAILGLPPDIAAINPGRSRGLTHYSGTCTYTTCIEFDLTFTPDGYDDFERKLTVHAYKDEKAEDWTTVNALITGSSKGPPAMGVEPLEIDYKTSSDAALNVGDHECRQVTISNTGDSSLAVALRLEDASGDFTVSPAYVPPVAAHNSLQVNVCYAPTAPSDSEHRQAPTKPVPAYLHVNSNDPQHVNDITVDLFGWAKSTDADDLLKLEMEFENGDSGWASNDFRNVDLEIESPAFVCRKPRYGVANGMTSILTDYCAQWTNYGLYGRATWFSVGESEEPERIIVYGMGTSAREDLFPVNVYYVEDCANIPTSLLSDLIGIGASTLLSVVGGAVGVPITVSPDDISKLIEQNCWSHQPTAVTVHIFAGSTEIASPVVHLAKKGDHTQVAKLRHVDGQFTLVTH
jgi:hypothetical protein